MKYLLLLLLLTYSCGDTYTPVRRADLGKYQGLTIASMYGAEYGKLVIRFTNGDSAIIVGGGANAACYFGIKN